MTPEKPKTAMEIQLLEHLQNIAEERMEYDTRHDRPRFHAVRIYVGPTMAFAYSTMSDIQYNKFEIIDGWLFVNNHPKVRIDAITHLDIEHK